MEPTPPPLAGPAHLASHPVWSADHGPVRVRFVGRSTGHPPEPGQETRPDPGAVLATVTGRPLPVARLRQVHSDRVLRADEPGDAGAGDGLWTDRPGLALTVVTADCVPVVLTVEDDRGRRVAAVHAGWRGIVAGVLPGAVAALAAPPPRITAWIGPAIGACCYEVGDEVAAQVGAAVGAEWVVPPGEGRPRPHLDLPGAARHQLAAAGVPAARLLPRCTHCDGAHLWSYRREGSAAGRNHAFVWIEEGAPP